MVGGHLDYVPLLFTQKRRKLGGREAKKTKRNTFFAKVAKVASYWQYKSAVALRLSYPNLYINFSAQTVTRIGLLEEIPRSGVQIPCLS